MDQRTVEEYLQLPYTIQVYRDGDPDQPGWVAQVAELPGCMTQGDTFEELGDMIADAMRAWIKSAIEDGMPVPEPRNDDRYSGKFIVRVPKSLHRQLVENAESEGVSLNMYVATLLGKAVGDSKSIGSKEPFLYPLGSAKRGARQTVQESQKTKR